MQRAGGRHLPPAHRDRLLSLADNVRFPAAQRLFEEHTVADRFWILKTGAVTLDAELPHRRPAETQALGQGEPVGLSWLFPPFEWELGAETLSPVRAYEFDAPQVRALCGSDPEFGFAISQWFGLVITQRLHATRGRLLDLYEAAAAPPASSKKAGARVRYHPRTTDLPGFPRRTSASVIRIRRSAG
ncbi:Crp/Fnr family transcriptional regulator [Streptomyces sp. BE133]|uniref:Crp/Fnr family transcriptional regulator n=1 Tax=Streptomyces sp. BE133 TaxID=3002523 RepID=UPI002E790D3A|nr:cyclic nucleotide-binding domain-containing protein [Streptomyces sp. BE133]